MSNDFIDTVKSIVRITTNIEYNEWYCIDYARPRFNEREKFKVKK